MTKFIKRPIFGILLVVLIIAAFVVVYLSKISYNSKLILAATDHQTLSDQSEWESGTLVQIDTSSNPGSIQLQSVIGDDWITKQSLDTAIEGASATSFNNKIYVIGGRDLLSQYL